MISVQKTHNMHAYWQDDSYKVFVVEILDKWTWNEGLAMVILADQEIRGYQHDVRMIYYFTTRTASILPKNSIFSAISRLSDVVTSNVPEIYFVCEYHTMLSYIQRVTAVTASIFSNLQTHKYRFTKSIDEALSLPVSDI